MAVRPFHVHYFATKPKSLDDKPTMKSACASERGAVRSAILRLYDGEFKFAQVYDMRAGVPIRYLERSGGARALFASGYGRGV